MPLLKTVLLTLGCWFLIHPVVMARPNRCSDPAEVWANALSEQLPLFINLQLTRLRAQSSVILVSAPELDPPTPLASAPDLATVPSLESEETQRFYLTTLEQRWSPYIQTQQFYYQVDIARSVQPDPTPAGAAPWQVIRILLLGQGIPPEDLSQGTLAQAIRAWQQSGCSHRQDLNRSG